MKAKEHFVTQVEGAVLGSVVGDALGVPAEFMSRKELRQDPVTTMRDGGAHHQPAGTWSDDTSMVLCTIVSLLARGVDYEDQMQRFSRWLSAAEYTARGDVFDAGSTVQRAIRRFEGGRPPVFCGDAAENACGNGSLMRIFPTALYLYGQHRWKTLNGSAAEIIHNTSYCTHAHPRCLMACGIFCSVVFALCSGKPLQEAIRAGVSDGLAYYRRADGFARVYREFVSLQSLHRWQEGEVKSSGFVLHTLQAALWCLLTTNSYAQCVLNAVNLGEDTDTTAAVAGALAGLWYGKEEIPQAWRTATAKYHEIEALAHRFAQGIFPAEKQAAARARTSSRLSRVLSVYHLLLHCPEGIAMEGLRLSLDGCTKTFQRDIALLRQAGENIRVHPKGRRYVLAPGPYPHPAPPRNAPQERLLQRLRRLCLVMREMPDEGCDKWYRNTFPQVSRRTMQRDFALLNELGYGIRYDRWPDYDPADEDAVPPKEGRYACDIPAAFDLTTIKPWD